MCRPRDPGRGYHGLVPGSQRLTISEAAAAALTGFVVLILTAPVLVGLKHHGLGLSQLLAFGAPPLLIALLPGGRVRDRLGLKLPPASALAAAILIGASVWLINWQAMGPLVHRLFGAEEVRALEERLTPDPEVSLAWLLLYMAILPAICEELMHRGAIARALGPAVGIAGATAISAAIFAISTPTPWSCCRWRSSGPSWPTRPWPAAPPGPPC